MPARPRSFNLQPSTFNPFAAEAAKGAAGRPWLDRPFSRFFSHPERFLKKCCICPPGPLISPPTGIFLQMASNQDASEHDRPADERAVRDFADSLGEEQRMLVILKSQLYGGSWESMLNDLRNRLAGKPYIFKLASRIKDDIDRIERMRQFESEQDVDLADYVDLG
jgi:hypothetical protein